jgi:hypothetical protein
METHNIESHNIETEFDFSLPRGYIDGAGQVHRRGRMRLATALDEILALQDPSVQSTEAYLPVALLSRVVTHLGELPAVTPGIIEGLFAADIAYLEDLYLRLNTPDTVLLGAICPHCRTQFQLQVAPLESGG